ncbi:uncharacterized protein MYCGRDRAFT_94422 [Zymoseptoria tritici IPO323]|uniref:Uncharacterized protein n=1 Tax=Zymoseptoria tritici (strain CBS 115943 / IPO323) TaxID=336722 RepID=F9XFM3_ZYMTI|nr:uncharacterized protein MYCGRDRAFT_94422 [Zymoseptoria tritici IPO323]EGP86159.1 hypothetical protein MYCGRDRAFT_94422 [Zymoseptoria tritici IPO323]
MIRTPATPTPTTSVTIAVVMTVEMTAEVIAVTFRTEDTDVTTYDDLLRSTIKTDKNVYWPDKFNNTADGPSYNEWLRGIEAKLGVTTFRLVAVAVLFVHLRTAGDP